MTISNESLASPLSRIFARVIDALLVGTALIIVSIALAIVLVIVNLFSGIVFWSVGIPDVLTPSISAIIWSVYNLLAAAGVGLYHLFMEASPWQATLGKRWLNCKVVNQANGYRIPLAASAIRTLVLFASGLLAGIPLLISGVMLFVHPQRQTLHDLAAKTIVIEGKTE
jgi:uncharacterized RDD family membrane protein YckC